MRTISQLLAVVAIAGLTAGAGDVSAQIPEIEFSTGTSSADESVRGVNIPLILSEPSASEVEVEYTISGTAVPGLNFHAPYTKRVLFAPFQEVASIYIQLIDNDLGEVNSDLQITLANPVNATLGAEAQHVFTVVDNDGGPGTNVIPSISFQRSRLSVKESVGNVMLEVVLSEVSAGPVEVDVEATGGSASNGGIDYTFAPATLTWAPGSRLASLPISIVDDHLNESNETIRLTLSNPVNGELGSGTESTVSIVDNDPLLVEFAATAATVQEFAGTVEIPVNLSVPSSREVTVIIAPGGTAKPDIDYTLASEKITFPAGATSQVISVALIDDDEVEETKTLTLTLRAGAVAFPSEQNIFTLSIESEDVIIPVVDFVEPFTAVNESAGTAEAELTILPAPTQTVSVTFTLIDPGTATIDVDYELPQLSVDFAAGQTTAKLVVNILDDDVPEVEEYFELAIEDVTNGKTGIFRKHKFWIRDNDQTLNGGISLFTQVLPTRDAGKTLTLIGPADISVNVRGLAVDSEGNLYITDQGPSFGEGEGSLLFCPANGEGRCIRLIRNMTQPGDVELTPDQRGFVISLAQGIISRGTFGFSLLLKQNGNVVNSATVHLFSEEGERVQEADPDGYYHFLNLMGEEASESVTVSVNHRGKTYTFSDLRPGAGENQNTFGHRILELELQP